MNKKIKKTCSYIQDTFDYLEAYKDATGNDFSETNEHFVKLGIANLEEIVKLEENHFSELKKISDEISSTKKTIEKQMDYLTYIEIQNRKDIGSLMFMLKDFMISQNYNKEEVEDLIFAGQKSAVENLMKEEKQ